MEKNIKKSYEKIKMPEESKEKIYAQIMQSADKSTGRRRGGSHIWKICVAACLAVSVIIPSSVYAIQKISQYYVEVNNKNYQAEIHIQKDAGQGDAVPTGSGVSKDGKKYIKIEADFGSNYKFVDESIDYVQGKDGKMKAKKCKEKEGVNGMYSYSHKNGFNAGKNFYYEVIYMDVGEDTLNLYDQSDIKEISVNNHKALLCKSNTVRGSRYSSDHDTDYNIDLYIFYEEYGYIINFCGMQKLGEKNLLSFAEKISVSESKKSGASRYTKLSLYSKGNMAQEPEFKNERVKAPIKSMEESVKSEGITYQLMDVKVSSKVNDTDLSKYLNRSISKLWKKDGTLKTYTREKLEQGDGISSPAYQVSGTEQVQLKMVYVTMKVKIGKESSLFSPPTLAFFEKEGDSYYDTEIFWHYNRPERIMDNIIDFGSCYFKETEGGTSFWIKDMEAGEEAVYHFAYLVDEDLVDNMFLSFGSTPLSEKYMRIS